MRFLVIFLSSQKWRFVIITLPFDFLHPIPLYGQMYYDLASQFLTF